MSWTVGVGNVRPFKLMAQHRAGHGYRLLAYTSGDALFDGIEN